MLRNSHKTIVYYQINLLNLEYISHHDNIDVDHHMYQIYVYIVRQSNYCGNEWKQKQKTTTTMVKRSGC